MKGSLRNKDDVKQLNDAAAGGEKEYIKLKARSFIRFVSDDIVSEYIHPLGNREKKFYREHVCLGGIKGNGYAPDVCPTCAKAKKFWDKRRALMSSKGFEKDKQMQAEAELIKKHGKLFQTKLVTKMAAVFGEAEREKTKKGKFKYVPVFEDKAKVISLSSSQWEKLSAMKKNFPDIIKTDDDYLNRNFLFVKETADGSEVLQTTPFTIRPEKMKSDPPEITNDIPVLDTCFKYLDEAGAKKVLNEFLENIGEETDSDDDEEASTSEEEDDDDEDLEDIDDDDEDEKEEDEESEDDDDDEEEEKSSKKDKKKKGKKSKITDESF